MQFFRRTTKLVSAVMTAVMVTSTTFAPLVEAAQQAYRIPLRAGKVAPSDSGNVTVSPTSVDFGDLPVGSTSTDQTVSVTNGSNTDISVGAPNVTGPFSVATECPDALSATTSCTYHVQFKPTSMGTGAGTLQIPTSAGVRTVSLSGLGLVTSGQASLGSLSYQQAVNTTSDPKAVLLTNTGNTPLALKGVSIAGSAFNVTHNCPASLPAGASCVAQVTFSPTAMGNADGNLVFGTAAGDQSVVLSGVGLLAVATLVNSAADFGEQPISTTSSPKTVTLRNDGNTPLAVSPATADAPFVVVTDGCSQAPLAAGASCTVSVAFAPSRRGDVGGNLSIPTNTGTLTANLSGVGLQTSGSTNVGSLAFGDVPVNTVSTAQAVTLNNTGNTPLSVTAVTAAGQFSAVHNCPAQLAAGSSCTVNVTFQPTVMGAASGTLAVATNGGTQMVSLGGTGRQAKPAVTPGTLVFGDQQVSTTSGAQTLTLSNSGNAATALGQVQVTGPFAVSTTCGATLAGGAGCTYSLTFNPVAMGAATGSVVIPTDAGNQTVSLSGNGLLAVGSATPASVGFGNQGVGTTSAAKVITLTNAGNMALDVTNVTVTGPFLLTNNCGTIVAASANCIASVAFAPTARGAQAGSLVFTTSDGAKTVALSGTGLQAVVAATPATLAFGNQTVGSTSVAQNVTVSNTGNTSSALPAATISGPFAFTTTCAASLAAGASCSYSVTFSPVAMNAATGTLTVPSDVGTSTVALSGFGQQASGSLSTGALAFGNQAVGSNSAAQSVKLTNTGNLALAVTNIASSGQYTVANNCGASVPAGGSCSIDVTFAPTTMGSQAGALTVTTAGGTCTASLSGTGLLAVLTAAPSSLAFGNQTVGSTSAASTVTLTNTGNTSASVSGATVAAPFSVASTTCGASLAASSSCTYSVTFSPGAMNATSSTLTIPTSVGNKTVALSGTGLQTSGSVPVGSLSFGSQAVSTTSSAQSVVLSNTGNTALTVSGVSVSGQYGATHNCPASLAVGASCTVNVTFAPVTMGAQNGTLTASTNGGNQTVSLSGTGLLAVLGAAPSSVAFGNQTVGSTSAAQTVTLTNSGNAGVTVSAATVTAPFSLLATTCGASLAASSSCTYSLTYSPAGMGGSAGSLSIPASAGTQTVSLSGTGLQTSGQIDKSSLAFGNQAVSTTSSAQTVTLSNTGNTTLGITSIDASGQFTSANNCSASLAAGATCAINVSFAPATIGAQSGTLTVTTAAGTYSATLSGTGLLAVLAASPSTVAFGNQVVNSASATQTVTLSNTGNTSATVSAATISSPFSVASTSCSTTLAAGANCTYAVQYTPTSMGANSGTLTLPTGVGSKTVSLSGTGLQTSGSVSTSSLALGSQNVGSTSTAQTFTLNNTGNTALGVTSIAATAQFAATSNCGSSVAAGANCTVNVTFTPAAMGAQTGTVSVATAAGTYSVSLSGTGLLAVASVSPTTLSFGNQTVGTTSTAQTVTLSNTGNTPMTVSTPTGNLTGPWSTNCPTSLAGGSSCTMTVTFLPQSQGPITQSFSMNTSVGNTTVTVTGTGVQTVLGSSPSTLSFGNVQVGQTATQSYTLTNSGNLAASGLTFALPAGFNQSSTCGTSLAAGASCTVNVSFSPAAVQSYSGSVNASSGSTSSAVLVSGTGTAQALTNLTGTNISMGSNLPADASSAWTFTFKNTGYGPVTSGTHGMTSGNLGFYVGGTIGDGTCNSGTVLQAGQSCVVQLYMSGPGSYTGTAYLNSSAGQMTFSANGTAVAPYFSDANLGSIAGNTTTAKWVTLTNPTVNAFRNVALNATAPYSISQSNCTATLASGASCSFVLTFNPSGNVNTWNGAYLNAVGFHYQMVNGAEQTSWQPGNATYNAAVYGTSTPFCTPGGAAWGGPTTATFNPAASAANCSTFLVLTVGGGAGGSNGGYGGGAGYVNVQTLTNLSGTISVNVGAGGQGGVINNSQYLPYGTAGTQSCFGTVCAGAGQTASASGGNGGSGGGSQAGPSYAGGAGGTNGANGGNGYYPGAGWVYTGGTGQGGYAQYLSLFKLNSVTAGTGGAGGLSSGSGATGSGGGGGGVVFNGGGGAAPGASSGSGGQGLGGAGWGGGGGGSARDTGCSAPPYCNGGAGAGGLVYVEWSK